MVWSPSWHSGLNNPALLQLWHRLQLWLRFSSWPGKFHMPQVQPKKKKKVQYGARLSSLSLSIIYLWFLTTPLFFPFALSLLANLFILFLNAVSFSLSPLSCRLFTISFLGRFLKENTNSEKLSKKLLWCGIQHILEESGLLPLELPQGSCWESRWKSVDCDDDVILFYKKEVRDDSNSISHKSFKNEFPYKYIKR